MQPGVDAGDQSAPSLQLLKSGCHRSADASCDSLGLRAQGLGLGVGVGGLGLGFRETGQGSVCGEGEGTGGLGGVEVGGGQT
jgi:hypothetical protein